MQTGPASQPIATRWTRRDACAVLLLAAIAVGVYANSLPNRFVYDDHTVVVQDQRSHGLSRIGELFSGGYWTVTTRPLYRPITLLSFAVNHAITGLNAPGYRAVNLLLHALTCVVVYRLMIVLFGRFWPAAVAGAVYAVHPIHVEAVVPIVGRSELLSGLTVLTALTLYVSDAARGGRGITWRYVAVVLLTWASMLCKESAIVLIGMVVAFDVWRRPRAPAEDRQRGWYDNLMDRFFWRYLGMLFVISLVLSMRQWAIGTVFGEGIRFPKIDNALADEPFWARVPTGLVLFGKYVRLLITGHPLCCDYSYNAIPVARSLTWPVAWGLACAVVLVAGMVRSLRRRREAALAAVFFLVSYAPVANVLVLIGTLFAERLMYLPSAFVAAVWGVVVPAAVARCWHAGSSRSRGIAIGLIAAAAAGLTTYGALTIRRNGVWRDDETLFRDGLARQPQSARCQYNMGVWYASHGKPEDAIERLQRAVEIADGFFLARTRLARCYANLGRWPEVIDVLEPIAANATSHSQHLISPLHLLGKARLRLDRLGEAWECFDRIRQIDPRQVEAIRCQAEIMARPEAADRYNPNDAWALIQDAVNLEPENVACLASATRIALRQHRLVEARAYHKRATEAARKWIADAEARGMDDRQKRSIRILVRDLKQLWAELNRQTHERYHRKIAPASRPATAPTRRP